MQQQINPPFDESLPCPACQDHLRHVAALLHNTFTRWPEPKAFVRLNDFRSVTIPFELTVPHPASQELVDVAHALILACDSMTDDGNTVRWSQEIRERVTALVDRTKTALDAFEILSNAHFHDERHATGRENVIRARHGSGWAGFVSPDYKVAEYNHTVEVVPSDGDVVHTVCGTHLKLHEYFLNDLRRDPTFFGRCWCPTCRMELPMSQFSLHISS